MNRTPMSHFHLLAVPFALMIAAPLAAQAAPADSFSLPRPAPTPAPEGPADERAGVAIPPRAAPPPRIVPEPVLTPEETSAPAAQPSPLALPPPQPQASPRPATTAAAPSPTASPAPTATSTPAATPTSATSEPQPEPAPGFGAFDAPAAPAPSAGAPRSGAATAPSVALGEQLFDWRWLAGGAALLVLAIAGLVAWRRRKPRVLRLAAPPVEPQVAAPSTPPRIDVTLEITGATRSVMMVMLRYRLTLANRSDRAVNDLGVAVQLACAERGQNNAAPPGAARSLDRVARIGPQQSHAITGEVQMPFAAIVPIMQGRTPLFIPLVHVTLEGEGQQAIERSFVIGTPSPGTEGRVQPLPLDLAPGPLPALRARAITAPAT